MEAGYRRKRLKDFEGRMAYAPESVFRHRTMGWEYIPVHFFAGERKGIEARSPDCWVCLEGDVALLECWGAGVVARPVGLYFRIDSERPHFRKLCVVFEESEVTREMAEDAMARFVELGFPDGPLFTVPRGGPLVKVDPE